MKTSTLYLLPSTLGDSLPGTSLPVHNFTIMRALRYFIVEDIRSARRFLKKAVPDIVIDDLSFSLLNEHTSQQDIPALLKPMLDGYDAGLLSEAGMPCIADPGASLVSFCHEAGIRVVPLSGPSSILMALAASGFNGQNFSFSGYLPVDKSERNQRIRELENISWQKDQTQIFIETPYRNLQLLESLIQNCRPATRLCIAVNLTLSNEMIFSCSIEEWKNKKRPELHKKPAVFLLYK